MIMMGEFEVGFVDLYSMCSYICFRVQALRLEIYIVFSIVNDCQSFQQFHR